MRELELTLRVRNNRLKERRINLGMSQRTLAKAIGVSGESYGGLESMRISPLKRNGDWRQIAIKLAKFHCVEPEELFPPAVQAVERPVAVRKMDATDLYELPPTHRERLLEGPESALVCTELREAVQQVLSQLTPKEANILRLRLGFEDGEEYTLEEVGERYGVTRERIRHLEAKALARLRNPVRVGILEPFALPD